MAKVAFLLASNFEDSEMKNPYEAIKEAGHQAVIIGLKKEQSAKVKKEQFHIQQRSVRKMQKQMNLMLL